MNRFGLAAICWTVITTILTLLPGKDLPEVKIVNFDKFGHLCVFGLLALLYLIWNRSTAPPAKFSPLIITLLCITFGGLIEILQGAFYTDRHADIFDFVANSVGCLTAWVVVECVGKSNH